MRHSLLGGLALISSLLLAGCGDDKSAGGGTTTPPAPVAVSSSVVKGVIDGGVVEAAQWQGTAWVKVAEAATNAAGGFSLQLPAETRGLLRLTLTLGDDDAAQMRCDAVAGCDGAAFGDLVPLTEAPGLVSWAEVGADGAVTVMPLTPLSTLVVRYAEAVGGRLDALSLSFARQRLALLLGMTPEQLLAPAGDITSAVWVSTTDASGLKVSLLSAGFAEMAAGQGSSINALIDRYVVEFLANDGRLLQSTVDDTPSLQAWLEAARNVAQQLTTGDAETLIAQWQERIDSLQAYVLNTLPPMAGLDSNAWLTAMGALGDDIRGVIASSGAVSLEHLLFNELNQFRWLLSADSLALVQNAMEVVGHVITGMAMLDSPFACGMNDTIPLITEEGYSATLDCTARTIRLEGSRYGMAVDLSIVLTSLSAGSEAGLFTFTAQGEISNERVRAHIDGTLGIDPKDTDLSGLATLFSGGLSEENLLQILNTLLASGHGVFTVEGAAGISNLVNGSELSLTGLAWADLDMNGHNGGVKLAGAIEHGTVVLPNGDSLSIRQGTNDALTFGMTDDAWFNARFLAKVLTVPDAVVMASGSVTDLGTLVTHARDSLLESLAAETFDLGALLANLLDFDFSNMHVSLTGEAHVAAWAKTYRLVLDGTVLRIYQPNSTTDVALQVSLGGSGVLVQAGEQWLRIGFDWSGPALTFADQTGGELRLELGSLLAML